MCNLIQNQLSSWINWKKVKVDSAVFHAMGVKSTNMLFMLILFISVLNFWNKTAAEKCIRFHKLNTFKLILDERKPQFTDVFKKFQIYKCGDFLRDFIINIWNVWL